jgi:hypothetical protein
VSRGIESRNLTISFLSQLNAGRVLMMGDVDKTFFNGLAAPIHINIKGKEV